MELSPEDKARIEAEERYRQEVKQNIDQAPPPRTSKCVKCKKEIEPKAKVCPHCGKSDPTVGTPEKVAGGVGCLVIILVAALFIFAGPCAEEDATKAARCHYDLQCWGQKHEVSARKDCFAAVERLAMYEMRWNAGEGSRLTHFRWTDRDSLGWVTYIGDKASFQNGFGAWQNMVYECDYDPAKKRILDARARPGRMP